MKKVSKRTYKGIDFIRLSSLSEEQAASLKTSLTSRTLIKILMFDEVIDDCVLYSAYEQWFITYQEPVVAAPKPIKSSVSLSH